MLAIDKVRLHVEDQLRESQSVLGPTAFDTLIYVAGSRQFRVPILLPGWGRRNLDYAWTRVFKRA